MHKSLFRMSGLSAVLVVLGISVCEAQTAPAGGVFCAMPFQVDGVAVSNSATVFASNRVDAGVSGCTFQRNNGDKVELTPQTEVVITPAGVVLVHGSLRIEGEEVLSIPSVQPNIRPAAQSIVEAQLAGGEWVVDVLRGSAQLIGAVPYARPDGNTRMRFVPDSGRPSGLDLVATGCAHEEKGHWYLEDGHIRREVELLNNSLAGHKRQVEVKGGVEPLANTPGVAARVQVISETATNKDCRKFDPILVPLILGAGAAAYGVSTLVPGSSSTPASIP